MITVKQFMTTAGLDVPHDRIKLVRHSDHLGRSIRQIIADGVFDLYQSEQYAKAQPFHNCDVIVSFIGIERNQAEFIGVYTVKDSRAFNEGDFAIAPEYLMIGHQDGKSRILYDLEEQKDYSPLRGRLIIQWNSTRGWVQTKDLAELRAIFKNPASHPDWVAAMKFTAAIYRIVDLSTGMTYIGSAYGKSGLWRRWSEYAETGHGNNKKLIGLDVNTFQWSIVRTLSGVMSEAEVIRLEHLEMRKHGSKKSMGLNH
jgi:hypothetical protein